MKHFPEVISQKLQNSCTHQAIRHRTSGSRHKCPSGPYRPGRVARKFPLPPLLPLPPPRPGRGANELPESGPLRRRTEPWRDIEQLLHLLLFPRRGSPLLEHGNRQHSRHIHQLFHQLRLGNRGTRGDVFADDLGHFDGQLGNLTIMRPEDVQQQLFLHLRHRNIEQRCGDDLLHSVSLYPLLRPDLREPVRPGAPCGRCFVEVETEELRTCRCPGCRLSPWGFVLLGPSTLRSGVVLGCSQGYPDAELLVAPSSSQACCPG